MSDTTVTAKAAPMSQLPQSGPKRVMLKGAILSLALLLQSISVTAAVVSSLKQDCHGTAMLCDSACAG